MSYADKNNDLFGSVIDSILSQGSLGGPVPELSDKERADLQHQMLMAQAETTSRLEGTVAKLTKNNNKIIEQVKKLTRRVAELEKTS